MIGYHGSWMQNNKDLGAERTVETTNAIKWSGSVSCTRLSGMFMLLEKILVDILVVKFMVHL